MYLTFKVSLLVVLRDDVEIIEKKSFPSRDHESAVFRRSRANGCLDSIPPNGPCPEIRL